MSKQQFLVDTVANFQTFVWEDNRKIIPSSAMITVYKPASDTKLIDDASMIIGSDGLVSYSLTSADNDIADENYKVVLSYVVTGRTFTVLLFYDVVRSRLLKVITDEDIVNELPQIRESGYKTHGTAQSGSTTTIVDGNLGSFPDDYFTGGSAYSITRDETRGIVDFKGSAGPVTTAAFSGAIATDKYILTRSFTSEIQRAFEKIEARLAALGKRPSLILDPGDLREAHIYFSVSEAAKSMTVTHEDFWWRMWQEYEARAEAAFRSVNFKYDRSDDGYISSTEEERHRLSASAGRR